MEEIRIVSTSTVQPASLHSNPRPRIELTPWDLQFLLIGPIQKGLLFLKPTPSQENQLRLLLPPNATLVDHLKSSFSRALEFFPPLAGRLGTIKNDDDDTSSFFVDCNNAGADFVHAVLDDISVSDIVDPVHVPRIVHSFFPLNGLLNYECVSKPLLAAQVTELADGFFIGCTMSHVVGDRSSFWHFFNSWSEVSRGSNKLSQLPFLNRWFPNDTGSPIHIPFYPEQKDDKSTNSPPRFEQRVFHFRREKIAALKAKANAETRANISTLQALLSHLWRAVVLCQGLDPDVEVKYKFYIGERQRLEPAKPKGYFGNSIHPETVTTTAGELLERGLGWVAGEMNKVIASQTNKEAREFLKSWVESPRLTTVSALTKNALFNSGTHRYDVYGGNDFGWGKPVAVRSGPGNKNDGKMTIFPGAEEGSIDIEVCLVPEKLIALGNDNEFMEAAADN